MRSLLLLFLLLLASSASAETYEFDSASHNPASDPAATHVINGARFTVLTENIIRVERSTSGKFEDRASLAFLNRLTPVPAHTVSDIDGVFTLSTSTVSLTFDHTDSSSNTLFSPESLTVTSLDTSSHFSSWSYGDENVNQLPGTIRTLDQTGVISLECSDIEDLIVADESYHCTMGLMSSSGHAVVVNDVNTPLLDEASGWWNNNEYQTESSSAEDFYIFTHGLNYKAALRDYSLLGGRTPIPPRYSLGVWFTRWINYNAVNIDSILDEYAERSLPLDVFILDMNWHKKNSWTGYSFDDRLFPAGGAAAIRGAKNKGVHLAANIHDAEGIGNWEDSYEAMASAVDFAATSSDPVPFLSCSNQTYAYALEDVVLAPLEDIFDFWWIDWQQGGAAGGCRADVDAANPTIWLNKLRLTNKARRNQSNANDRSMVLARWGGLGNHRYQVGFSGDVDEVLWDRLAYQPYFTATAANVGYGLWSHDLVGPNEDSEMFLRWLQWGSFSPVFRTHDRGMSGGGCANTPEGCNMLHIWDLPQPLFQIARSFVQQRAALMPYIYTATRKFHTDLLSFLRPMYHDFPEEQDSFDACTPDGVMSQYMFGDDMFVAPVVSQVDSETQLADKKVWIPPGTWVEVESGQVHIGPSFAQQKVALAEMPRFARAGSVVPHKLHETGAQFGVAMDAFTKLMFSVYNDGSNAGVGQAVVYEDDGQTLDYSAASEYAELTLKYKWSDDSSELAIQFGVEGSWKGMPELGEREVFVEVENCPYSTDERVAYNGNRAACMMRVDLNDATNNVFTFESKAGAMGAGLRGVVTRANAAKSELDEAQMTPGSMTGQQCDDASLTKLASLGAVVQMYAEGSSADAFYDAVSESAVSSMVQKAAEELQDLYNDQKEQGADDATLARIGRAMALIEGL
jgi:alpha-glucosidase